MAPLPSRSQRTSNSTGAFTYSVVSGPATISGSTVTLTGAGTVTLMASEAADSNYAAATKNATFTVTAGAPDHQLHRSEPDLWHRSLRGERTSNSTGAFTYSVVSGPATISGSTVTLTGAGTVTHGLRSGRQQLRRRHQERDLHRHCRHPDHQLHRRRTRPMAPLPSR